MSDCLGIYTPREGEREKQKHQVVFLLTYAFVS